MKFNRTNKKLIFKGSIYILHIGSHFEMLKLCKEHVMNSCCFDLAHLHNHSNSMFFKFIQDRENLMVIMMLGTSSTNCRDFSRPDFRADYWALPN